MIVTTRLANPETDYLYIAELLTLVEQTPTTVERLREWDRHSPPGQIRRRSVAVDDQGRLVGYSVVFREASDTTGRFKVWVTVDPAHRRRGIGNLLYRQGLQLSARTRMQSCLTEFRLLIWTEMGCSENTT